MLLFGAGSSAIQGCECYPAPRLCKDYSPGDADDHAFFIGRVTKNFPDVELVDDYFDLIYGKDRVKDSGKLRNRIKLFWKDYLTPQERRRLETTLPLSEIADVFGIGPNPVFTSFQVDELLHGPLGASVDVVHGHPEGTCDPGFAVGARYLVEVVRVNGRWYAGYCSQTRALHPDIDPPFLKLLRRNVQDRLPKKFLFGVIHGRGRIMTDVPIRVTSSSGYEFETKSLDGGLFLFEGLPDERFELSVPGWGIERIRGTLDLTQYSCSDVQVMTKRPN